MDQFVVLNFESLGVWKIACKTYKSADILKRFNQLSQDELEFSFGEFTPVQEIGQAQNNDLKIKFDTKSKSLNPYMTKLELCSIQSKEKVIKTSEDGQLSEMFYRPEMFRLDPVNAEKTQGRNQIKTFAPFWEKLNLDPRINIKSYCSRAIICFFFWILK